MAKKNLCGVEIEYAEDKEFHEGMFHCYAPHTVDGEKVENENQNFVTIESKDSERIKIIIIAMCPYFEDARAIVCAMNIAKSVIVSKAQNILKEKNILESHLSKDGYNIEAMEAKMDELLKSGKSNEDILKYMNEHREDFIVKKTDAKSTDDSKERW